MTREEFIKQRCEIDKITEEEFEKRYRVVKCNCGQPYCKGYRCLDFDGLLKENQELKKHIETYEIEGYKQDEELNKMSFDIRKYKIQQKDFIKYLENMLDDENDIFSVVRVKDALQKYREIIGDDK